MVSRFEVRPGEEDAFVALHESVDRSAPSGVEGPFSTELLFDPENPSMFVTLARYRSREAADAHTRGPGYADWHRRVVTLTRKAPDVRLLRMAWHSG